MISKMKNWIQSRFGKVESFREPIEKTMALPDRGLTQEQANERKEKGYANESPTSATKSVGKIVLDNTLTYFNVIFFVLAALLLYVGAFNHLTFLVIVTVNTVIGIVQEINAKRTLDKLKLISEPKARVVRDGAIHEIAVEETVRDDVVCFSAGNHIYADAVVLSGEVQVNESLITGEADEIGKKAGDRLTSGSFIISGNCRARLEKVGHDSFVSSLTLDAKKMKRTAQPGMMKSLTLLIKIVGLAIIPIGILMYLNHADAGMSLHDNIVKTTGALIGMIPEGLYLLVSVALALSIIRLAKKKTLVHEMKSIETLARVDTLCVDKTGTITEPQMFVSETVLLAPSRFGQDRVKALLSEFSLNMNADNETMRAIQTAYPPMENGRKALSILPFSSSLKFSGLSMNGGEHYVLGAPEMILKTQFANYAPQIEPYTQTGSRVLLLASCPSLDNTANLGNVTPIALVLLKNRIRPSARKTFEYFAKQGVAIKVISGDNPLTASLAACEAGIPGAEKYIDATRLTSRDQLMKAANEYTVFGRVTPEQKKHLVSALHRQGHTVAMTGDGVNDVLALKEADCSIAMSSGSDVACHVANLVLLDNDFSSLPSVVAEGRRVINNIERSASLFLVKNIFSFVLALLAILIGFDYPLTPAQLSLISGLTIGIPSFVLALEPNEEMIRGKFLRNVIYRALPAAITDLFVILGTLLFAHAFPLYLTDEKVSTVTALLIGVVGFFMVYRTAKPFNRLKVIMFIGILLLFVLAVSIMPAFFHLFPLDFGSLLVLVVFVLMIPSVMNLLIATLEGIRRYYGKAKRVITEMKKSDENKAPQP